MSDHPARHLSEAAEQVRAFNLATDRITPQWQDGGHTYTALGGLAELARRLEQATRQSVRPVIHTFEEGRLRVEGGGGRPACARVVRELVDAREEAVRAAVALAAAVDRMHSLSGLIVGPDPAGDDGA